MVMNKANKLATSCAAGLAALSSIFAPAALAQQQTETPNAQELQQEPWIQASRWARSNPQSVAIYVSVGTHETNSLEQFKSGVEKLIEDNFPIDAEVFVEPASNAATLIIVFADDTATEPTAIQNLGREVTSILNQKKAKDRALAPEID